MIKPNILRKNKLQGIYHKDMLWKEGRKGGWDECLADSGICRGREMG